MSTSMGPVAVRITEAAGDSQRTRVMAISITLT